MTVVIEGKNVKISINAPPPFPALFLVMGRDLSARVTPSLSRGEAGAARRRGVAGGPEPGESGGPGGSIVLLRLTRELNALIHTWR